MYKFLLKRKIKKILNLPDRKKAYHNLKEIKNILVLFDTEDYRDASHFIDQLKKMGKKVKAVAYKDKTDANDYSKILFNTLIYKDLKDIKNETLTQILNSLENNSFDLVVDLTLKENLLLQYVLVSVQSPLKVGFYRTDLPIHDMVISFTPGLELNGFITVNELGKQLIYYLTVISSGEK
jgi:hypothetical protein